MAVKPLPGPIAKRAADEALANAKVGVSEAKGQNNWGPFVKLYLAAVMIFSPAAWCLAFQIFRLKKAAKDLGETIPAWVPITGYTPTFVNAAKKAKLWIKTAEAINAPVLIKKGDLAFFYMASMKRIAHVGVVIEVHSWGVTTVEANTSPDKGEVKRDGDGVFVKQRSWSELGDPQKSGFARLPF